MYVLGSFWSYIGWNMVKNDCELVEIGLLFDLLRSLINLTTYINYVAICS